MEAATIMNPCQKVRTNIKDVTKYITSFQPTQQSAALELLFSQAMGFIFHLQLFTSTTDDMAVSHKVVWLGADEANPKNAPASGPDAIISARHFDALLEVTQNTGTKQWD